MRERPLPGQSRPHFESRPPSSSSLESKKHDKEIKAEEIRSKFNQIFDRLVAAHKPHSKGRQIYSRFNQSMATLKHLPIYRPEFNLYLEEISQVGPNGQPLMATNRNIGFESNDSCSTYRFKEGAPVTRVDFRNKIPGHNRVSRFAGLDELNKFQALLESAGVL